MWYSLVLYLFCDFPPKQNVLPSARHVQERSKVRGYKETRQEYHKSLQLFNKRMDGLKMSHNSNLVSLHTIFNRSRLYNTSSPIDHTKHGWFNKVKLFRHPRHLDPMLQTISKWNTDPLDLSHAQRFVKEVCVPATTYSPKTDLPTFDIQYFRAL